MKKNILVTGANGYIGSHITSELIKKDSFNVIATDFNSNNVDKKATFIKCDILNEAQNENLYEKLNKPNIILHLAWKDGFNHNSINHIKDLSSHFLFLKNLIDKGSKHVALAGSFREYGKCKGKVSESHLSNGDNLYALAKSSLYKALEIYFKNENIVLQNLRFFTPYGDDEKNNSILSKILTWEKEGKKSFPFTEGREQYDYIHIDELTKQVIATISQNKINGIINICSGYPTSLKEMVEKFLKENNLKIKPEYGAFKTREYDSSIIFGDKEKITKILEEYNEK